MTAKATLTFESDLLIWGASVWWVADLPLDVACVVAEYGDHYWPTGPLWDYEGQRTNLLLNGEPVPVWWSLPYLTNWLIAQERPTLVG